MNDPTLDWPIDLNLSEAGEITKARKILGKIAEEILAQRVGWMIMCVGF